MLFVEPKSATLAVVEVADGSIVELHRQPLQVGQSASRRAAHLATMVAGLDARGTRADGVFLIGCGADVVSIKPALEAVDFTSGQRARGARHGAGPRGGAGVGERAAVRLVDGRPGLCAGSGHRRGEPPRVRPLDVSANADWAMASRLQRPGRRRRRLTRGGTSLVVVGSALAAISAVVAAVLLVSLTADRPSAARQYPRAGVANPAQVPSQPPQAQPPQAQLPAPSSPPPRRPRRLPRRRSPLRRPRPRTPRPPHHLRPRSVAHRPRAHRRPCRPRCRRSRRPRPHRLPNPHLLRCPRARR